MTGAQKRLSIISLYSQLLPSPTTVCSLRSLKAGPRNGRRGDFHPRPWEKAVAVLPKLSICMTHQLGCEGGVFQTEGWYLAERGLQANLPQRVHDYGEGTRMTYKNWRVIAKGGAYVRGEDFAAVGIAQLGSTTILGGGRGRAPCISTRAWCKILQRGMEGPSHCSFSFILGERVRAQNLPSDPLL
ncbi:transmembrane protein 221 [Platysternon megacephalum]|uniref:Transmembrane protein 221 n=1 Tax=Platysternon megacephalum TaxID=55544 RepID=A0A4D9E801_9SAUR|nr:transmembrane protein 221 [Platysternon megacephalum]